MKFDHKYGITDSIHNTCYVIKIPCSLSCKMTVNLIVGLKYYSINTSRIVDYCTMGKQ